MPIRVQRKRTRGFRLPPGCISVTRPGPFGNPFVVNDRVTAGKSIGGFYIAVPTREDAIDCFRLMLEQHEAMQNGVLLELRGHDLACFCKLSESCHADILLEFANRPEFEARAERLKAAAKEKLREFVEKLGRPKTPIDAAIDRAIGLR